jgi:hypothetical protein
MIGFPATKNRFNSVEQTVPAAPYAFRTESVPEEEYRVLGLSADTHVVLSLNLKKGFDQSGKLQHFPKPHGMSGSPIMVLYDEERGSDSRVFPAGLMSPLRLRRSAGVRRLASCTYVRVALAPLVAPDSPSPQNSPPCAEAVRLPPKGAMVNGSGCHQTVTRRPDTGPLPAETEHEP